MKEKKEKEIDIDNQVDLTRYKLYYEDTQFDETIRSYESGMED